LVMKAHIQTYGCQMNEHDSFRIMEILASLGYEPAQSPQDASLVIINTCSVRRNPENKVYSYLGTLRPIKERNPGLVVAVAGCVAQQEGENLLKKSSLVNLVFGPDNYFRLPEMLDQVHAGKRVVMTGWAPGRERVQNFIPEPWLERGHVDGCKAYIAISKGCNNFCSFCIVPHVRGREVSRELDNILREARDLIAKGAREIWLLGQNVNSYKAGDNSFYHLLDAVSRLPLARVRFTSPHPKDWSNDLADLMAGRPTICSHLHLPLQAGADRILKLMNRRHTILEYLDKLAYLKSRTPAVEISTDLIVGFPTETDDEFEQTLDVMRQVRFSQVFSFKYSPRPGTKACELGDDIPRDVKEDRLARLIALQDQINAEQMAAYLGGVYEVLVDGTHPRSPGVSSARTDGYRPVSVAANGLKIGNLVPVRITGIKGHWLLGDPSEDA